jgi:hypothetical protein
MVLHFSDPGTIIRVFTNEVFISILRPLAPNVEFEELVTVKKLLLGLARTDVALSERYVNQFTLRDYSCQVLCGLYNTLFTLVPHLDDPMTHQPFAKACLIMRQTAFDYPMACFILQAVEAFAWINKISIPGIAAPYFEDLGIKKEDLVDMSLGFPLPQTDAVRLILAKNNDESRRLGIEMSRLLTKWGGLSID